MRTQALLWLSRGAGESLIMLAEALAVPEPREVSPEETLAMAVRDLYHCFLDLEFLDHDEALHWGPLGVEAFQTQPVLGEMLERLQQVTSVDLSGEDSMNPLRALYGLWAEPEKVAALGQIGAIVAVHQQEGSDQPSMIDDPLACTLAGLICDLPCIAVVLRQVGSESSEMEETMTEVADRLEAEARRLEPLLPDLRFAPSGQTAKKAKKAN